MDSNLLRMDRLFNTPIESGLRTLIILADAAPIGCDLQRLAIYDYLLVHSDDVTGGPPSLHPPSPFRSGELLVRGELLQQGLYFLQRKGLVEQVYADDGITFRCTKSGPAFLNYMESSYARQGREIARWIRRTFETYSDVQLRSYADRQLGRWGTEFTTEGMEDEE